MEKKNMNYTQLALDISRGTWLLKDAENFLSEASSFLSRREAYNLQDANLAQESSRDFGDDGKASSRKLVGIVPICGVLNKYDTCSSYGTVTIAETIDRFCADDNFVAIVLDVDSPGGCVNAVMPIVSAIKRVQAAGKPILVHADECASGALWIASQADAIFMDNDLSEIGSIGAYIAFVDNRVNAATGAKLISVYAPESTDKNRSYREALDGKTGSMEKELSDIVAKFQAAVKAGRPGLKEKDGVMSGAMFKTAKAIELHLADGQASLAEVCENAFTRAEIINN